MVHQLKILIKKEDIGTLLVGLPLALTRKKAVAITLRDVANEQMRKVLRFIDDARNAVAIPVETIDERLSTREADHRTRGQKKNVVASRDAIAAAIILQSYLDRANQE